MAKRARRRPFRRRSVRAGWHEAVVARWPELEAELLDLRRYNAHGYRKRLLLLAQELGLAPKQPEREYPYEPSPSTRPDWRPESALSVEEIFLPEPEPEPEAPRKKARKKKAEG